MRYGHMLIGLAGLVGCGGGSDPLGASNQLGSSVITVVNRDEDPVYVLAFDAGVAAQLDPLPVLIPGEHNGTMIPPQTERPVAVPARSEAGVAIMVYRLEETEARFAGSVTKSPREILAAGGRIVVEEF